MNKKIYYNNLYDYYQGLLTEKQRQYFIDYYCYDLSLSEMAENYEISRNAIFKQLKQVEKKLDLYEETLQCFHKKQEVLNLVKEESLRKRIEEIL